MPLERQVPPISELTLRFFRRVVRTYFRRQFRAVLAQHAEQLSQVNGPLVVYGNHSSWWDPMLVVLLGEVLLPGRRHYAPMDALALERYPILRRLGIFPVDLASARGAAQFLRTAEAILREDGVLWLTPQGRFADVREFPLAFKPGLSALAKRMPEIPLIPLAVEYTFWDERLPECLLLFGERFHLPSGLTHVEGTRQLEDRLTACMLTLQRAAMRRDPAAFTTVFSGRRGTGGVYGWVQRLRGGRRVQLDHSFRPEE